jgi:hypothetical protein
VRISRTIRIALVLAALAGFLFPVLVDGCSIVYKSVRVGKTFRARVLDRGRPVSGLRLVLTPRSPSAPTTDDARNIYSRTDARGYASFSDLNPGAYFLTSDHDGEMPNGVIVDVSSEAGNPRTIQLTWPNYAPLGVRSASGTLRLAENYPKQLQSILSLSLVEAMSQREIATTQTDTKGRFAFGGPIQRGIYLIGLNDPSTKQSEGMITIEVDGNAKDSELDLTLGWSTCGLSYSPRRIQPDVRRSKICGTVLDAAGAVVSGSGVFLLTTGDPAVTAEQATTDGNGRFVLRDQSPGVYQLVVTHSGFQPFVQVVHIERSDPSEACDQPITAELSVQ